MELFKIGFVSIRLVDIIDISVVTFLLFKLYDILRGSLALRVIGVILSIFLLWKVVQFLDLVLLKSIMDEFLGLGAVALVIIFAPEIRKFLAEISKNTLVDRLIRQANPAAPDHIFEELWPALREIRTDSNGALIVITGTDPLKEIQETGDIINSDISARLIYTIFQKQSPLHDGAMIIHKNKIKAVRCILPISKSDSIPAELGLRHRAALGISEQSNALVLVVSEERGEISIATGGFLKRNVDDEKIKEALTIHFQPPSITGNTEIPKVQSNKPSDQDES